MLTPAFSAIRLVLALSKPSLTRMRAVASISASTVARERPCVACLRGCVSGLRAMPGVPDASSQHESSLAFYRGGDDTRKPAVSAHPQARKWSTPMHHSFKRLFAYKAWADDALLTALARLGDDSPVTPLAIKALSHAYVVDR